MDRDTELALVEGLRRGDAETLDRVHAAFNTRLFTFLVRLSRRRDVAEDLLEDSAMRGLMALWPYGASRSSPFEETAASELERRIERALAAMPAAAREVLLLVGVAGLDHSDAADVCGITPEALRQRLHRARQTLSQALERDAVADELASMEGVGSCPSR